METMVERRKHLSQYRRYVLNHWSGIVWHLVEGPKNTSGSASSPKEEPQTPASTSVKPDEEVEHEKIDRSEADNLFGPSKPQT